MLGARERVNTQNDNILRRLRKFLEAFCYEILNIGTAIRFKDSS